MATRERRFGPARSGAVRVVRALIGAGWDDVPLEETRGPLSLRYGGGSCGSEPRCGTGGRWRSRRAASGGNEPPLDEMAVEGRKWHRASRAD